MADPTSGQGGQGGQYGLGYSQNTEPDLNFAFPEAVRQGLLNEENTLRLQTQNSALPQARVEYFLHGQGPFMPLPPQIGTPTDAFYPPQNEIHSDYGGMQGQVNSAYAGNADPSVWPATSPSMRDETASNASTMAALATDMGNLAAHLQSDSGVSPRQQRVRQNSNNRTARRAKGPGTSTDDVLSTGLLNDNGDDLLEKHAVLSKDGYWCRICTTDKSKDGSPKQTFRKARCDMIKHIKTHVKPYRCNAPNCKSQGFATKNDLERHMKQHADPSSLPYFFAEALVGMGTFTNDPVCISEQEFANDLDDIRYAHALQGSQPHLTLGEMYSSFMNETPFQPSPRTGNASAEDTALQFGLSSSPFHHLLGHHSMPSLPSSAASNGMSLFQIASIPTDTTMTPQPMPHVSQTSWGRHALDNGIQGQPDTAGSESTSFRDRSLLSQSLWTQSSRSTQSRSTQSPPVRKKHVSFSNLPHEEQDTEVEGEGLALNAVLEKSSVPAGTGTGGVGDGADCDDNNNDDHDDFDANNNDDNHNDDSGNDGNDGNDDNDNNDNNDTPSNDAVTANTGGDLADEPTVITTSDKGTRPHEALGEKTSDTISPDPSQSTPSGNPGPSTGPSSAASKETETTVAHNDNGGGDEDIVLGESPRAVVDELAERVTELSPHDLGKLIEKIKRRDALIGTAIELQMPTQPSTGSRSVRSLPVTVTSDGGSERIHRCAEANCLASFSSTSALKKHMNRHKRPFACTHGCKINDTSDAKAFGSKNDWKRHEESVHYSSATPGMVWVCDEAATCSARFTKPEDLSAHLVSTHSVGDKDKKAWADKLAKSRRIPAKDARFWCGFCPKQVDTAAGTDLMLYSKFLHTRFNHIDNHYAGRNCQRCSITDWRSEERVRAQAEVDKAKAQAGSAQPAEAQKRPPAQPSSTEPAKKKKSSANDNYWNCTGCGCPNAGIGLECIECFRVRYH